MGVKKFIKKSVAFVAAAAMALTMVVAPVGAGAGTSYAEGTEKEPVYVKKTAKLQSDGTYKITLESYVTGNVTVETKPTTTPCDIVLVLDQSGSMAYDMSSETTYVAREARDYSYNDISDVSYYYKDGDKYYEVNRDFYKSNKKIYYYLYYQKDGKTYYLSGSSTTTNRPNNITDKNSTIWNGVLYEEKTTTTSRLAALQRAANSFIDGVAASATKTGADHRIAVVGFAGDGNTYQGQGKYMNTELFIGSNQYNYGGNNNNNGSNQTDAASIQYGNALQSIKTKEATIKQSINNLAANGGTYPQFGLEMANGIFNAYKNNNDDTYQKEDGTTGTRNKIIVVFTDGSPGGTTYNPFNKTVANSAISEAKTSKDNGAKVYSVGIFSGADASLDPSSGSTSNQNKFMHFISSNYPNAESMTTPKSRDSEGAYYKSASNADDLKNIFKEIAQDTVGGSASVSLGKEAISKDIISDNFDLPAGITAENVKDYVDVSTVDYLGNGTWSDTKVPIDDRSTTLSKDDKATISLDKDNKTFNVSNFDFSANYVGEGTSQSGETKARGKKLVIEITGITAKHSGEGMETNNTASSTSGIYTGTTLVKAYNKPTVSIPDKSYVLDYGKTVVSDTIENDCGISNVQFYNTVKPSPHETSTTGRYGTFDLTNAASGGTITYTPGKINWDGFDSAYVFGAVGENEYLWSAVNFIPASSVYYEDDFGTSDNGDSEVSIVWSGNDWSKAPDSSSTSTTANNQSSKNEVYGWDDSYKDNLGYSNGSATMTNTKGATATFTFTGTGVDVYSRTNGAVGLIRAELYSGKGAFKADGTTYKPTLKTQYIDNVSTSGDYYQIPTLSFENLDYGTYTVVITAGAKGQGSAGTYYLDGIRVYNPLQGNTTAENAYDKAKPGESNAQYIKLRDTLLADGFGSIGEGETAVEGSVFIDDINGTSVTTGTKVDYEKYGPKNEVYLAPGQAIAFEIDGYENATTKPNVFVGLKALNNATTVTFTNDTDVSEENINSASDLYYPVTPTSSGKVIIRNTGNNLLSITKLRITNASSTTKVSASRSLLSYAQQFDSLKVVQNADDQNTDDKDETLDKGDVDIDNPSDNDNKDDSNQGTNNSIWNNILNYIKNWFSK